MSETVSENKEVEFVEEVPDIELVTLRPADPEIEGMAGYPEEVPA